MGNIQKLETDHNFSLRTVTRKSSVLSHCYPLHFFSSPPLPPWQFSDVYLLQRWKREAVNLQNCMWRSQVRYSIGSHTVVTQPLHQYKVKQRPLSKLYIAQAITTFRQLDITLYLIFVFIRSINEALGSSGYRPSAFLFRNGTLLTLLL